MSLHQAHRLPWETLGNIYRSGSLQPGRYPWYRYRLTDTQKKQIRHFSRCLADALQEFAASDRRPPEDDEGNSLDPEWWGELPHNYGHYTGYYYSLLKGYVHLNLLLMDPTVFQPILQQNSNVVLVLCGYRDGGHPEWMSKHLQPILTQYPASLLEPLTVERLQIIRDHCALLFRCLYSISGENLAFDPEFVAQLLTP